MFCPDDHVLLSELVDEMKLDIGELERPVASTTEFYADIDALERAFVNWLLLAFFKSHGDELRVCTPSGAMLRLSAEVLRPDAPKFSDAIAARWDGHFPRGNFNDLRGLSNPRFFKFLAVDHYYISVDDRYSGGRLTSKVCSHQRPIVPCRER